LKALLIVQDALERDRIAIGLANIPGAVVEVASGPTAVERARRKRFDVVFIGHDPRDEVNGNGLEVVARLREFDKEAEVIIVTDARHVRTVKAERERFNIASILRTPIDPNDFFRLAARLRTRRNAPQARVSSVGA
jgi:DNA-binding NtrC family response regulator